VTSSVLLAVSDWISGMSHGAHGKASGGNDEAHPPSAPVQTASMAAAKPVVRPKH
jgi:hypothetical protein